MVLYITQHLPSQDWRKLLSKAFSLSLYLLKVVIYSLLGAECECACNCGSVDLRGKYGINVNNVNTV